MLSKIGKLSVSSSQKACSGACDDLPDCTASCRHSRLVDCGSEQMVVSRFSSAMNACVCTFISPMDIPDASACHSAWDVMVRSESSAKPTP